MDLVRTGRYLFQDTVAVVCVQVRRVTLNRVQDVSGNAAVGKVGHLPNRCLDAAVTPTGSVQSPEVKAW
jgi:hypothetical protein